MGKMFRAVQLNLTEYQARYLQELLQQPPARVLHVDESRARDELLRRLAALLGEEIDDG
jgi:hypothetical protein